MERGLEVSNRNQPAYASKRIIRIGQALTDLHTTVARVLASVGDGCVCLILLGLKVDLRGPTVTVSSHLFLIPPRLLSKQPTDNHYETTHNQRSFIQKQRSRIFQSCLTFQGQPRSSHSHVSLTGGCKLAPAVMDW